MNFLMTFLFWVAVLTVTVLIPIYLFSCFTKVKEGTSRQVVRFGAFRKSLLAKEGYKLDKDWNVVENPGAKTPFWGGLCWVSLLRPIGIDKIHVAPFKFVKALSEGGYEKRDDKANFLYTGTQYQYALLFSNAEDSQGVPLSGQMTMTVIIKNPYKALFTVKNWFDALIGRVLPVVRDYISNHRYEDIIYDPGTQLDIDVFKILKSGDPNVRGGVHIYDELLDCYGLELVALETVNIDPPEGYRAVTLARWMAGIEAEAQALRISTIDLLMDKWVKAEAKRMKKKLVEATEILKADKRWDRQLRVYKDLKMIEDGGLNVSRVEFGTPDGGPLPAGLKVLSMGGNAGAGVLVGTGGKGNRDKDGKGGSTGGQGDNKAKGQPSPSWTKRHGGNPPK